MNVSDLLQSYFGPASAERLGREAGLSAAEAGRVLRAGLPLQLGALADHARTPEGQEQIGEAVRSLPAFASVEDALSGPEGASQLGQAGAILVPALLGNRAGSIAEQVADDLDVNRVQRLLHLALPLLLSFLGQRGLTATNVGSVFPGLKGSPGGGRPDGAQVITGVAGASAATSTEEGVGTTSADTGPLTPEGLIDFLRGQFSGAAADRVGRAAGFGGGTASRATQAALPLVLNAIAGRASTEGGASDLLDRSRDFERLAETGGGVNVALLSDSAEAARIEGQGRGLLGSLFPNVDRITGRLGSAVGGSGANAGRLLALLTPLVLGLIARRVGRDNLGAGALSRLLGGLRGSLVGMLPSGMSGLAPLLEPATTETVVAARPSITTAAPAQAAPTRPAVIPPPAPPVTTTVTPTERRRGFPWWLIPLLLLLLLGGYWFLRSQQETTAAGGTRAAGAAGDSIRVIRPTSGTALPADDFVMSGVGPAGDTLRIAEGGQELVSVTVGADGNWEAAIPAPAPGEHTYTVTVQGGASREVRVDVTGTDGVVAPTGGAAAATGESP